jgi:Family of unknown function (DUF6297)
MTSETAVPSARRVRRRLRRARSAHRTTTLGERLTDVYLLAMFVAIYGTGLATATRRHVRLPPAGSPATADTRAWLALAGATVLVGLIWHAARSLGPLYVTPPARSWAAGAPVDRRAWLAPSLGWLLVVAAGLGGLLAGLAVLVSHAEVAATTVLLVTASVAGAVALAAATVVAQSPRSRRPAFAATTAAGAGAIGPAMVALGVLMAAAVLLLHADDVRLPMPEVPAFWVAASTVACAVVTVGAAVSRLGRHDMAVLSGGAQLADAVTLAVVLLQPSMFSDIVEVRRWRRVGWVRSRRFVPPYGRVWALLQADLRRQARRPAGPLAWLGLVLVPYAALVVAPGAAAPVRVVAAFLATERLCAGLRAVCRSPSLRRALGGTDRLLRATHLVVPGIALGIWWAMTLPARGAPAGTAIGWSELILAFGVLLAAYRAASRRPTRYDGPAIDTPFGLIQPDLIRQLVRGLDVLAIVALAAYLLR